MRKFFYMATISVAVLTVIYFLSILFCFKEFTKTKSDLHEENDVNVLWRHDHYALNNTNVYHELLSQGIDYPEIVLAQAILETGNYKSYCCTNRHNLFGLRRRDGSYMEFGHWTESVGAYKKYIQKYQETPEDYYQFLDNLGYAEDSIYVVRVRQIVKTQLKDFIE